MKKLFFFFLFVLAILSVKAQSPSPTPADPPLEDFVGKYVFPDGSVVPDVEVTLADSALTMMSVQGNSSLAKLGVDSFSIVEFSGTAVFKRGDDKKVNAVHIEAAGYILDGKKDTAGKWSWSMYLVPDKELVQARN